MTHPLLSGASVKPIGEMLALRFDENGLAVRKTAKPDRPGEALVRVVVAGICNTDLEIVRRDEG